MICAPSSHGQDPLGQDPHDKINQEKCPRPSSFFVSNQFLNINSILGPLTKYIISILIPRLPDWTDTHRHASLRHYDVTTMRVRYYVSIRDIHIPCAIPDMQSLLSRQIRGEGGLFALPDYKWADETECGSEVGRQEGGKFNLGSLVHWRHI